MLDDRYYMRSSGFRQGLSATLILLIANAAVFIVQLASERWFRFPFTNYFALSVEGLRHGMVWQLLSFQFLHGGWLHLLLNCWAIYVFGREVEHTLGVPRFLSLYFLSGVFGGLLQTAAGFMVPDHFGGSVVGASAGAFGLVAAFATLYPERPLTLLLFFIIPVSMRAKFLLLFSGILAVLGILFPGAGDNIAHAAHLGGMIVGVGFIRYLSDFSWRFQRETRAPAKPLVKVRVVPGLRPKTAGASPEDAASDYFTKEIDPILDKISAHGIQSLTQRERDILESARKRMGQR